MRILVVDDDRVFTEPLVWRLQQEGHDVVYCQTVSEALDGWFELTEQSLESLRGEGLPNAVFSRFGGVTGLRCRTMETLAARITGLLGSEDVTLYMAKIERFAHQDPLVPKPDCIVLDLMMPRDVRYTKRETDSGRSTGMAVLRDILKRTGSVPVVVMTVRAEPECHIEVRKRFKEVKPILVKPVTPTEVLAGIDDAVGITRKEN